MRQLVIWSESLAVHVDKIDDQHKELYRRMNEIVNAVMDGKAKEEINDFTRFLVEYTDFHFRDEESLMTQHAYPGYNAQKSAHDYFRKEVQKMRQDISGGGVAGEVVTQVVLKLGNWFNDHIRRMDRELGQFLKPKM
jgi:hemerythrin